MPASAHAPALDTNPASSSASEFFRCPVQPDRSEGTIRIGRQRLKVEVHEASIDGFTVLVRRIHAERLRLGRAWTLYYDGAVLEVHAQWLFHAPDGNVQVGIRRLRDLTPEPTMGRFTGRTGCLSNGRFGLARLGLGGPRGVSTGDEGPPLLLCGAILGTLASLSMPGIGDALGTRGPIQAGIASIGNALGQWLR